MTKQVLTTIRIEKELNSVLRLIADKEHRTKLDELRFLIYQREKELNVKEGGSKKKWATYTKKTLQPN